MRRLLLFFLAAVFLSGCRNTKAVDKEYKKASSAIEITEDEFQSYYQTKNVTEKNWRRFIEEYTMDKYDAWDKLQFTSLYYRVRMPERDKETITLPSKNSRLHLELSVKEIGSRIYYNKSGDVLKTEENSVTQKNDSYDIDAMGCSRRVCDLYKRDDHPVCFDDNTSYAIYQGKLDKTDASEVKGTAAAWYIPKHVLNTDKRRQASVEAGKVDFDFTSIMTDEEKKQEWEYYYKYVQLKRKGYQEFRIYLNGDTYGKQNDGVLIAKTGWIYIDSNYPEK